MNDLIVRAKNSPHVKAIKSPEWNLASVFLRVFVFLCLFVLSKNLVATMLWKYEGNEIDLL